MINGLKILAIIPARAGSKRVINKNIRDLGGIPLIGWTLKDLSKSKYIDHAYVSTDSADIQQVARSYQVDADPLRPSEFASDTASSVDVVMDVIDHKKTGYDIIVLLQPTSPFRKIEDVDIAIESFISKKANSVTSVCESESHPSWSSKLPADFSMQDMIKNLQAKRSQDLEAHYRLNGAIYITTVNQFRQNKSFLLLNLPMLI